MNNDLARRIVDLLNSMLELDRPAVAALIANRVPCSEELANHPTVIVRPQHGGHHVGVLGILNALCVDRMTETHEGCWGAIAAVFGDGEGKDGHKDLIKFALTKEVANLPCALPQEPSEPS